MTEAQKRVVEALARAGTATGGRCYGYAPDGSVIEHEAEIVREVYGRFAQVPRIAPRFPTA